MPKPPAKAPKRPQYSQEWWTPERRAKASQQRKAYWAALKPKQIAQAAEAPEVAGENGGLPGNPRSEERSRRRLTLATLEGMQRAFDKGGQKAIEKVMKLQPAIFLKMLVLLVPREMNIEHSGSVKDMTDQQIDDAIAAIKQMIADRERQAKLIDVTPVVTPEDKPVSEP